MRNRAFHPLITLGLCAACLAGAEANAKEQEILILQDDGRSNWEAVEEARDRGAGRIVDPDTWELERLEAERQGYSPGVEIRRFEAERDRELRLEKRDRTRPEAQRRTNETPPAESSIRQPRGRVGTELAPADPAPDLPLEEVEPQDAAPAPELAEILESLREAEARELDRTREKLKRENREEEWEDLKQKLRADYARWRREAIEEYEPEESESQK